VRSKFNIVPITHTIPFPPSSAVLSFPLETQESEENFDLALIASLEIDVVPHLGDSRVPDHLILRLGKMLHSGSLLQQPEDGQDPEVKSPNATLPDVAKLKSRNGKEPLSEGSSITTELEIGTTRSGKIVPRERFSYWCFDLLLLICSDAAKGMAIYMVHIFHPLNTNRPGAEQETCRLDMSPAAPQQVSVYASGVYRGRRTKGKSSIPKVRLCVVN